MAGRALAGHLPAKRSSSAVVAQRLYSSPTAATTAKVRAERTASDSRKMTADLGKISGSSSLGALTRGGKPRKAGRTHSSGSHHNHHDDSGHFSSSDTDYPSSRQFSLGRPLEGRKQSLISGASDDEVSVLELRQRQRRQRRDYVQTRSPKTAAGAARKESPSPGPKSSRVAAGGAKKSQLTRGRRSSDECTDESLSPPATPSPRSASGKAWSRAPHTEVVCARRAASSGNNSNNSNNGSKSGKGFGFGSGVSRFPEKRPLSKVNSASSTASSASSSTSSSSASSPHHGNSASKAPGAVKPVQKPAVRPKPKAKQVQGRRSSRGLKWGSAVDFQFNLKNDNPY